MQGAQQLGLWEREGTGIVAGVEKKIQVAERGLK